MQQIEGKTDAQLAEEARDIARHRVEKEQTFEDYEVEKLKHFANFLLGHSSIDIEVPQYAIDDMITEYYQQLESNQEEE